MVILGHADERGRFTAGRPLAVKAVTDSDEGGIGIELEFDCAACALSRVLLCHMVSFPCVSLRVAGGAVERKACQPAVDGVDHDRPFSNARRNPLNRVGADIPTAKMPGTLVSYGEIGVFPSTTWPVLTNPFASTATQPLSQSVLGTAPIIKKRFDVG